MAEEPKLEIVEVPIGDLNEYGNNAKLHDRDNINAIKASIEAFGNCDPIGVWKDDGGQYVIVEGHGRKKALQELGYEKVPCIMLNHLTDEERRAYALAHNQTTLMSGFDIGILDQELDMLPDFDMGDFGFEDEYEEDLEPIDADDVGTADSEIFFIQTNGKKWYVTEEESELFTEKMDRWVQDTGLSYGFIKAVLDD